MIFSIASLFLLVNAAVAKNVLRGSQGRKLPFLELDPRDFFVSGHPCYNNQCGTQQLNNGDISWYWYDDQANIHEEITPPAPSSGSDGSSGGFFGGWVGGWTGGFGGGWMGGFGGGGGCGRRQLIGDVEEVVVTAKKCH